MKKISKTVLLVLAVLLGNGALTAVPAAAQGVGMVTGSETGTYIKFGQEIADVVKPAGLDLIVKPSEGSIANIKRLMSKENAALAIVQSDVLGFVVRSDDPQMQRIANKLRLVFPFYNEEVHLFARKDIESFADLEGKRVVIGKPGSGNWLTTNNLLSLMRVNPAERLELSPTDAVAAVLANEADAMVYVAGKPVTAFSKLEKLKDRPEYEQLLKDVHFARLDDPTMRAEYQVSSIGPGDYGWFDGEVPTIAVKAVLISFDFSSEINSYYRQRCQQLAVLGKALRDNIDQLKRNGHPKWQEVNLDEKVGIWELDTCSQQQTATQQSEQLDETDITDAIKQYLYE